LFENYYRTVKKRFLLIGVTLLPAVITPVQVTILSFGIAVLYFPAWRLKEEPCRQSIWCNIIQTTYKFSGFMNLAYTEVVTTTAYLSSTNFDSMNRSKRFTKGTIMPA